MEVIRNVSEITGSDRVALEHLLGRSLGDDQQVVVRVVNRQTPESSKKNGEHAAGDEALPEWCNVFEGLSDDEITAIETVMLTRADLTRPGE